VATPAVLVVAEPLAVRPSGFRTWKDTMTPASGAEPDVTDAETTTVLPRGRYLDGRRRGDTHHGRCAGARRDQERREIERGALEGVEVAAMNKSWLPPR
jgi:hypothetical protein